MEIFDASPLLIESKNDRSSWSEARIDKIGLVGSCSCSARDRLLVIRATEENGMNFKERWDSRRGKNADRENFPGLTPGGSSSGENRQLRSRFTVVSPVFQAHEALLHRGWSRSIICISQVLQRLNDATELFNKWHCAFSLRMSLAIQRIVVVASLKRTPT